MPSLLSTLENLIEIAKEIREIIKPKHLEAMKKCPFWSFYEPFHEGRIKEEDMKRKQKGLEFILNSFNPVKEVFVIEGKEFKSTVEQLAVIFGLHRTTTTRNPKPQIKNAARVFRETYLKGERIRKKDIKKYLYATAEDENKQDDFIKLLVLYFCVEVFFPFENGTILPMEFFNYVFVMDTVSWPDLIHSYLMKALKDAKKPIKSLRGCTVYILFWFAEVTHFTSKYEGEQGESKPRFARWNIKELAEKIANKGMTTLRQDLTGSFVDPLDDGEQSLITPVEIHQVNPDRIGGGGRMGKDRERVEDRELSPDRDAAHNLEDL
ncbi:hypothetical protein MKW94_019550, partial [Papaver nudicaule]|nr:hypothetical protein [Papaver nudicaule]